jgi:hypothetical protein
MRQVLLKYCGGCNPTINRSKIIAEVKRGLPPDVELVSKTEDQVAEVGIMMSGCSTTCLDREDADQIIKKIIDCLPPASK